MLEMDANEEAEYFVAHVRILLEGKTMEGLEAWAKRFSELRQISEFELCQRLANAIRTSDLPDYGLGIVRYSEGWLFDRMGRWQDAVGAYRASLKEFQEAGIPLEAALLTQIGSIQQDQGDWQAAEETYTQALAAATDEHVRALTLNNLGNLALMHEDLDAAQEHYDEARKLLGEGDRRNFAAATHGLAAVLLERRQFGESQKLQVECLAIFQALGDMQGVESAVGGIATAQLYAGHPREAIHNYEASLRISVSINDQVGTARALNNLALAHQTLGEYDIALDYLREAIIGYQEVGNRHGEAGALVNLARLHAQNKDLAAAQAASDLAKNTCELYGFPQKLQRLPPEVR